MGKIIRNTYLSRSTVFTYLGLLMLIFSTSGNAATPCIDAPEKTFTQQNTVIVDSVASLESAIRNLVEDTTVLIRPGEYRLTTTLYVRRSGTVLRGETGRCDDVTLIGPGMENANFGDVRSGVWIDADNVTVANLTIRDVYFHPIEINRGPDGIEIYNVRLLDAGEQFIKANSAGGFGRGSNFGKVEYSIMEYTNGPPLTDHGGGTGYTNGVDVHGGDGWQIRNNIFKNFHTPDGVDHLFNPAILMWNGSSDTLVENNTFINVDRAIAFGLINRTNDHSGGIIRNNMITMAPNLFSNNRVRQSDASIILWSSPNTKVVHNTVISNGNSVKSIELRFGSTNVEVINNLVDEPIVFRRGGSFTAINNVIDASEDYFENIETGDLHLTQAALNSLPGVGLLQNALLDVDGQVRPANGVNPGADQFGRPIDPNTDRPNAGKLASIIAVLLGMLLDEDTAPEPL